MTDHSPLRTDWTDRVVRGTRPDAAALRAHLRAVHRDHAGFTEACARACRDAQGRTSYAWLAETVAPTATGQVLDLACGSGPLLEELRARAPGAALVGVDMCPEELALAADRLPAGAARLIEAQAQALDMLPDGSVDAVLCHWALTLMDPLAPVLAEVARLVAPAGRFAALVDGPMDAAPGYRDAHDLIYGHVQAEVPGYGRIDLGDPRVRGTDSLTALVRAAFPDAAVDVETGVVTMEGPAPVVAETAAGFFYAAFVVSTARRGRMLAELATSLPPGQAAGHAVFAMPVNRLTVTLPG